MSESIDLKIRFSPELNKQALQTVLTNLKEAFGTKGAQFGVFDSDKLKTELQAVGREIEKVFDVPETKFPTPETEPIKKTLSLMEQYEKAVRDARSEYEKSRQVIAATNQAQKDGTKLTEQQKAAYEKATREIAKQKQSLDAAEKSHSQILANLKQENTLGDSLTQDAQRLKTDYESNVRTILAANVAKKQGKTLTDQERVAVEKATQEVKEQKAQLELIEKEQREINKQFQLGGQALDQAKTKASGFMKVIAINQGVQMAQMFTGSIDMFLQPYIELDKQIQNVGTLGVKNLDEIKKATSRLSTEIPDDAATIGEGLYQAISAGAVKAQDGIVDIASAMDFVEIASKAGVAGLSDTKSAVDGLSSVLNAYGMETSDAGKVADTFFAGIKTGKTSFEELNSSIATFVPLAAASGVSFEEATSAIASMTTMGTPTAQAATQIRAALVLIQKGGPGLNKVLKESGRSLTEFQEQLKRDPEAGGGLLNTLTSIRKVVDDAGMTLPEATGRIEAASAILQLTGENAQRAADTFGQVKFELDADAASKAFDVAAQSISAKSAGMMSSLQAMFDGLFMNLDSSIVAGVASFNKFAPALAGIGGLATAFPTESVGKYSKALLGKLVPALVTSDGAIKVTKLSMDALKTSFLTNPFFLAIAGAAALVGGLHMLSDALHKTAEEQKEEIEVEKEANQARQNTIKSQRELADARLGMVDSFKQYGDGYKASQDKVKNANLDALESESERMKSLDELSTAFPDAVDSSKSYEENLASLKKASEDGVESTSLYQKQLGNLSAAYPGVIDTTKSYEENLQALQAAAEETRIEIENFEEQMIRLQTQEVELDYKLAVTEVGVASENLNEQLGDALSGSKQGVGKIIAEKMGLKGAGAEAGAAFISALGGGLTQSDYILNQVGLGKVSNKIQRFLFGKSANDVAAGDMMKGYQDAITNAASGFEVDAAVADMKTEISRLASEGQISDAELMAMTQSVEAIGDAQKDVFIKEAQKNLTIAATGLNPLVDAHRKVADEITQIEFKAQSGTATDKELGKLQVLEMGYEGAADRIQQLKFRQNDGTATDAELAELARLESGAKDVYGRINEIEIKAKSGEATKDELALLDELKEGATETAFRLESEFMSLSGIEGPTIKAYQKIRAEIDELNRKKAEGTADEEDIARLQSLESEYQKIGKTIEDKFVSAQKEGKDFNQVVAQIAETEGITETQARELLGVQEGLTREALDTAEGVDKIDASFSAAFQSAKEEYAESFSEATTALNELREARASGDQAAIAAAQQKWDLLKGEARARNQEVQSLQSVQDAAKKAIEGEKKKKEQKETEFEITKKLVDQENKRVDQALEWSNIQAEGQRLAEGREKNAVDEYAAESRKLTALERQKKLLIEMFDLKTDDQGEIVTDEEGNVSIGISLTDEEKANAQQTVNDMVFDITKNLASSDNTLVQLKAKVEVAEEDFEEAFAAREKKKFEFQVEMGIISPEDADEQIMESLQTGLDATRKELEDLESRRNDLTTQLNDTDDEEERLRIRMKLVDVNEQIMESEEKEMELASDLSDKVTEQTKKRYDTELDLVDKTLEAERKKSAFTLGFLDMLISSTAAAANKALDVKFDDKTDAITSRKESEIERLDELRNQDLVNEEDYQRRKRRIEKKYEKQEEEAKRDYENRQMIIAETARGEQLEAQRQADIKELQIQEKAAQLKIDRAIETGADEETVNNLRAEKQKITDELEDKNNFLSAYKEQYQGAVSDIFAGMFSGDTEAMKDGFRGVMSVMAGVLKTQLSATISKLVLDQLMITPGVGVAGIVLYPILQATINAGIGAILNPIINNLLSFSTGGELPGRYDDPTAIILGDASKARPGSDTEWVFRDDQIAALLDRGLARFSGVVLREIQNSNSELGMKFETLTYQLTDRIGELSGNFVLTELLAQGMFQKDTTIADLAKTRAFDQEAYDLFVEEIKNFELQKESERENVERTLTENRIVESTALDRKYEAIKQNFLMFSRMQIVAENRLNDVPEDLVRLANALVEVKVQVEKGLTFEEGAEKVLAESFTGQTTEIRETVQKLTNYIESAGIDEATIEEFRTAENRIVEVNTSYVAGQMSKSDYEAALAEIETTRNEVMNLIPRFDIPALESFSPEAVEAMRESRTIETQGIRQELTELRSLTERQARTIEGQAKTSEEHKRENQEQLMKLANYLAGIFGDSKASRELLSEIRDQPTTIEIDREPIGRAVDRYNRDKNRRKRGLPKFQ